jgi:hypothetical protein
MVSSRDITQFLADGQFNPKVIDPRYRARTVVFQSWIDVGDQEVLVSLTNGKVLSIDHGRCFCRPEILTPPSVVVAGIPGVDNNVGRKAEHVRSAVNLIESITDEVLLRAVAQIPNGERWNSAAERRLAIGRWLAYRRDRLRRVMRAWEQ